MIETLSKIPDNQMTALNCDSYIKFYDTVRMKQKLSGYFMIKNSGKKILKITDVKTGCSCIGITTNFSNKALLPGDSTKLTFTINSFSESGYFSKAITVFGNFNPYYRRFLVECYVKP
jgi:hypothetical protein